MFIKTLVDFIKLLKNQGQTRYHSETEIVLAINRVQDDLFQEEIRRFEKDQVVTDKLEIFKETATVTLTSGSGNLPANYRNATDIYYTYQSIITPIRLVRDGEWSNKQKDVICPPELDYPICRIKKGAIKVLPATITSITLEYLRYPVDAIYATTTAVNGRDLIFTTSGSVDVEWPRSEISRIALKTLKYLGVPMEKEIMLQAESLKPEVE